MIQTRFELDDYTIRVLDVVKGKYGLKNRNEALKKFVEEFGGSIVELEPNEKYVEYLDNIIREHEKEYGKDWKPMTVEELDELLGLDEKNV